MVDLGVEPTAVEPGRVQTRLAITARHGQHTGVVHAGVIAAVADHTMGAAAQTLVPEGHWVLTAEFKVNLLRGAAGEQLECVARVVKPGRQITFTEAEVFAVAGGERRLVATASGTMAVTLA
ncbi:MAG: PaaI family thioesterase [Burkholderiales bacterium]|nr:MAG: PaaI family thioesterase [Burkholderiales bacterium]